MKKIFLTLIIALISVTVNAQVAYYDALFLRDKVDTASNNQIILTKEVTGALKMYYPGKSDNDITELLLNANPFFKGLFVDNAKKGSDKSSYTALPTGSIGSINVTNIADGIAQFLIKRGKEELNVSFFKRMKDFLEDPNHPECKTLFPATTEFLENIASYQYAELIQSMQEAFHKDLSNLVINLNQLIDLPKFKELLKNLPEIRVAIRSAKIVSELSQSAANKPLNPAVVIEHLSGLGEWKEIDPNLGSSWKLLNVISKSVRNTDDTHTWITMSEMNILMSDPVAINIFLGLLYERVAGIEFTMNGTRISVQKFIENEKKDNNIYAVTSLVENFSLLANDVDRTISDLVDKNKPAVEDYFTYMNKAINIIDYAFKAAGKIRSGIESVEYVVMARNAIGLYKNIYTKSYSMAAMNVYSILDQVFNHAKELANERVARLQLEGRLLQADTAALFSAIRTTALPSQETISTILKYGNFIASVVKAESASEVQTAIEAAALPAGSFSIKHNAVCNISLNGYIGYGWDFDHGNGVYAPIGFSFSTRLWKTGGSVSLFASLIDVGSVASYRLTDNSSDTLKQEVRLESIFSPGLQLMLEPFSRMPLTFFTGWRMTPKQFYSKQSGFIVIDSKSVWSAGIVIDIPILTLHNKSHTK